MGATEETLLDGPWLDRLNPAFLAARYPSWAGAGEDFAAAAAAFARHGWRTLAALDNGLEFDPAYFREANPAWEGCSDLLCYRDWLMEGLASGRCCSAAAHLERLGLPLYTYPDGFPWTYYARLRPQAGAHRWAALDDFCRHGFAAFAALPFGPEAVEFLYALGNMFSTKNDTLAIRAFELAQSHAPLPSAQAQHLADAYLRLGLWRPAQRLYDAIIDDGQATGWTVRNVVKCAARLEGWSDLLHVLQRTHHRQAADPLWPVTVAEAGGFLFDQHARAARILMAQNAYHQADRLLGAAVEEVAALFETFRPASPPREDGRRRSVFVLANLDDPDAAARRVTEKSRLLDLLGRPHEICPLSATERYRELSPTVAAIILFRVPALPAVIHFIVAARRAGVPTLFESDIAVHDPQSAPPIEGFRGRITAAHYDAFRFGVPLHDAAARLCDFAIAPTERLAAAMRPLVRRRRSFVIPNSLLPEPASGETRPGLRLFLRAASLSFIDAHPGGIGGALLEALARWPDITLQLRGPVHLDALFDVHADRLHHAGSDTEPQAGWPEVAACDVNLAIVGEAAAEAYRGEVAWAEAASLAVPSLLIAPPDRLPMIRDDVNALRAADAGAVLAALQRLRRDPVLRRRLGAQAQRDAARHSGTDAALRALDQALGETIPRRGEHVRFA